jgi:hypothetical protein
LVHCRGGVGRAGLIACCWMLKMGLCGWIRRMDFPPLEHPFQSFFNNNALEVSPDSVNGNSNTDPIAAHSNGVSSTPPWPQNGSTYNATADSNQPRESPPEKRPNGIPHTLALVRLDTMDLVERAIRVVRRRRSVKAIETFEQVHFLVQFVEFLRNTPTPHSSCTKQQ